MPLYKRKPFEPNKVPKGLKDDEEVYYFKLTNEIFRDYDEYYARVILCNSMVWSCALTGKANLTFQEALDSEKSARKLLKGFQKNLKRAILYTATLTNRAKLADAVDDVVGYARDRYFKGEEVLSVIGNLWCQSRVINVIEPTAEEIEAYRQEQLAKGPSVKNDYLDDDTWGPSPDIFRYEVQELDPDDPSSNNTFIMDSIDVKREKAALTRDKCKFLLKLAMDFDEQKRKCVIKDGVLSSYGIDKLTFDDIFVGKVPIFDTSLAPAPKVSVKPEKEKSKMKSGNNSTTSTPKGSPKSKKTSPSAGGAGKKTVNDLGKLPPKEKKKKLTAEQLRQLELEQKIREREKVKEQRKLISDFRRMWWKPKEDLEVEDLKDLPTPDPVSFSIPNNLFGDFMMVLEFMSAYSSFLKVRDCFSSGVTLDILERALTKTEIAGPFSDILQLLLKAIFRLQEGEKAVIAKNEGTQSGLVVNGVDDDVDDAITRATSAATWCQKHQNTPLHKLSLDYSSLTEVLRLHLLASGAKQTHNSRGSCAENDDPGLYLRLDEPQILQKLSTGTVFDLALPEKLKVLQCLIHQVISYYAVKDIMEDSFELFRQARVNYRSLVAAEKKKEAEDNLWRQRLRIDRVIPDMNALKAAAESAAKADEDEEGEGSRKSSKKNEVKPPLPPPPPNKPLLTDEQIEAAFAKKDKEIARRKQEFAWKEAELLEQINKHERKLGAHPMGRDRAYRRYWIFSMIPGLFVEQDDEFVGTCLPSPTPCIGEVNLNDINFVRAHMNKLKHVDKEGSDKENSQIASPKKSSKKKSISNGDDPTLKKPISCPSVFGLCTADEESCPVHCQYMLRPKWSFFWDPEQVDVLIAGLSPRGIREKELKQNLTEARDALKGLMKKCPFMKLNTEKEYPESITTAAEQRRSQRGGQKESKNQTDPNLGFAEGTSIEKILELQLRDLILELEEKIHCGALGSLKVADRNDWRTAVEGSGYRPGTEALHWGGTKTLHMGDKEEASGGDENSGEVVRNLCCALLQVQQAIEPKFMQPPLVERDEDKKKKKSESETSWKTAWNSTPLERWQISLMKSVSFSQLFVHLYSLESSVAWSRSVLNARCRICRRKGDPENMLLCDSCNKGHHTYCLKPALESLPKGDWFCVDCRPEEALPTPSKKRKYADDEDDLENSNDEGSAIENGTDDDEGSETCHVCGYVGEVICCDGCPLVYHLLCLNPPKTRVPRGDWYCPECTRRPKGRTTNNSRNAATRRPVKAKRKLRYDESDESEEEDEDMEDDEEEDYDRTDDEENSNEPVKVKFGKSVSKKSPETSTSTHTKTRRIVYTSEEDDEEDSDRELLARGGKRKSASDAAAKISQAAKRLRGDSKDNDSSETSSNSSAPVRKRTRSDDDLDDDAIDRPKRTRLHRTNRVANGGLDNVLLDKLISDIMKHNDAWPFLKPVTRTEAPDYFGIVKNPMDLGTIKHKLNTMLYTCNEEVISDLLLVFTNCFLYNDSANHVHQMGLSLKEYVEKKCAKLGINFSDPKPEPEEPQPSPLLHEDSDSEISLSQD